MENKSGVVKTLIHKRQEQDEKDFEGFKQDYHFDSLPVYMTVGFHNTFGPLSGQIINACLAMINLMPTEKERIQVFYYGDIKFWVESNWEVGTEKSDYVYPEELGITFLLPSEH